MLSGLKKPLKILLWLSLGFCILVFAYAFYVFKSPALKLDSPVFVRIDTDDNSDSLLLILKNEFGFKNEWGFKLLSRRMNLNRYIKNGRYTLQPEYTLLQLIRTFREGRTKAVDLTIKPLGNLEQLAARCGKKLEPDSQAYIDAFTDSIKLSVLGFNRETVYALPVPDTYNLLWHTDAEELILYLKKAYDKFWTPERRAKLERCRLNEIQVSTLASIVAKETNKYDEMPMVAGMYINRLRMDMPLQADPTVKFALNQPGLKRIYSGHLQFESPYNTYLNTGLPPGPICIPSVQSIDAVLNYSEHGYLFMCAKEDFSGYHNFAADYRAHLINAGKYRKALDERGIR